MNTMLKVVLIVSAAYYVCWQLVVFLNKIIGPDRPAIHSDTAARRGSSSDILHPRR